MFLKKFCEKIFRALTTLSVGTKTIFFWPLWPRNGASKKF